MNDRPVRTGNFDTMRTLAALGVVVSHSFLLSGGSYEGEPVFALSHGQTTIGGIAVLIFFVLSGYLITQSFHRAPDTRRFMAARLLRIMPALVAVVLLAGGVLGPLCSDWGPAYFSSPLVLRYVAGNLSFLQPFNTLPGVFTANPFPDAVNGSLWTLRFEAACYGLVLGLGLAGLLQRWTLLGLTVLGLVALGWLGRAHSGLEFITDFGAGACFYVWQPRIRPRILLGCTVLCGVALWGDQFRVVSASAGAVLILALATSARLQLPSLSQWGDLSYGIYLYAFPIQQVLASWLGHSSWLLLLACALPPILMCAAVSWHGVERRALAWRGWLGGRALKPPLRRQGASD